MSLDSAGATRASESDLEGFEYSTEIVVVGSGAGGLVAALAAHEASRKVLIIEGSSLIGGSSAISGGGIWIPNNPLMKGAGVEDSFEEARTYLDAVIGDVGPASSPAKREAYLREGPRMVEWLSGLGFKFIYSRGYPDYYPEKPGGCASGRAVEGEIFDLKRLGEWAGKLRMPHTVGMPWPLPMHTFEAPKMYLMLRTVSGFAFALRLGSRMLVGRLLGRRPAGLGASLIGQLLHLVLLRSIPIWLECPMVDLVERGGRVIGVIARRGGKNVSIEARCGVILASGGFAHNLEMRREYHPHPITVEWTVSSPTDMGDGIRAGVKLGAATALMDEAWWGPVFVDELGSPNFLLAERALPYSFIVDSSGKRYVNEAAPYVDFVHAMYERCRTVLAIPSYLVLDSRHRRYYLFGRWPPGLTPRRALERGAIVEAGSLEELARKCGIDPEGLVSTAERFNHFCRTGRDEDFHRGESAYDRFYGDPSVKPNPNLGPVERPPFYCVKVWPGDLGTKGGLLTDEFARVLRRDGSPIVGLYAVGNVAASTMGRTYPGPGSTLGPAMVFGMIAGFHAAGCR
jgi:succinate dehydrogenase/fumarate reductase flavoprotein subunit